MHVAVLARLIVLADWLQEGAHYKSLRAQAHHPEQDRHNSSHFAAKFVPGL